MSDLREFTGTATIRQHGPRGMITLRGDLSDRRVKKAVTQASGADMPAPNRISFAAKGPGALVWMSRDEVLVLCPHLQIKELLLQINKGLKGIHFLANDVSDARISFSIDGPGAREVLAKLAPVDLHPDHFGPGDFRRTRLAQIGAAFWMRGDGGFDLLCYRSVADYAWDLLCNAAAEDSRVGVF